MGVDNMLGIYVTGPAKCDLASPIIFALKEEGSPFPELTIEFWIV